MPPPASGALAALTHISIFIRRSGRVLALIVAGIVWLLRALTRQSSDNIGRRSPALDALEERYARGEISRDEYLEKRRDIS